MATQSLIQQAAAAAKDQILQSLPQELLQTVEDPQTQQLLERNLQQVAEAGLGMVVATPAARDALTEQMNVSKAVVYSVLSAETEDVQIAVRDTIHQVLSQIVTTGLGALRTGLLAGL